MNPPDENIGGDAAQRVYDAVLLAHEPMPGYTLAALCIVSFWLNDDDHNEMHEHIMVSPINQDAAVLENTHTALCELLHGDDDDEDA